MKANQLREGQEIHDIEDPILREIYYEGYDKVIPFYPDNKFTLLDSKNKVSIEFDCFEFKKFVSSLTIKSHPNHTWIADSDGSNEKFHEYIKNPSRNATKGTNSKAHNKSNKRNTISCC